MMAHHTVGGMDTGTKMCGTTGGTTAHPTTGTMTAAGASMGRQVSLHGWGSQLPCLQQVAGAGWAAANGRQEQQGRGCLETVYCVWLWTAAGMLGS